MQHAPSTLQGASNMNKLTYIQHLELIDIAANEDRLYHHNGGQAYIRISMDSNALMIIDHTMVSNPQLDIYDGSHYFEACKGYNWEHSKRLREYGSMVTWFITNYPEHAVTS
jgi:hypothetical protein